MADGSVAHPGERVAARRLRSAEWKYCGSLETVTSDEILVRNSQQLIRIKEVNKELSYRDMKQNGD